MHTYIIKEGLLDWLYSKGRVVQQWLSVCWGGQKHGHFSIHKAGCLNSPNLSLKAWKTPGELLVFSSCWKVEEAGLQYHQRMTA